MVLGGQGSPPFLWESVMKEIIGGLALVTLVLTTTYFVTLIQLDVTENSFVIRTTDVSKARSVIRECTKTIGGVAEVETIWINSDGEEPVPESWFITCQWEKE
jgi:hypothetical protein